MTGQLHNLFADQAHAAATRPSKALVDMWIDLACHDALAQIRAGQTLQAEHTELSPR